MASCALTRSSNVRSRAAAEDTETMIAKQEARTVRASRIFSEGLMFSLCRFMRSSSTPASAINPLTMYNAAPALIAHGVRLGGPISRSANRGRRPGGPNLRSPPVPCGDEGTPVEGVGAQPRLPTSMQDRQARFANGLGGAEALHQARLVECRHPLPGLLILDRPQAQYVR